MDKRFFRIYEVSALLTSALLAACSSPSKTRHLKAHHPAKSNTGGTSEPIRESIHSNETKDYREIELLYSKNLPENNAATQSKMNAFILRYPESPLLSSVENLFGLLLLRSKNAAQAIPHFAQAAKLSATHPASNHSILYNLAIAQFDAGQIDAAQQTSSRIQLDVLDKSNQIKVYHLRASIYEKKSLPLEAIRQLLAAGKVTLEGETSENRKTIGQRLDPVLQKIDDPVPLQMLYSEFEDSSVADALLFRLGTLDTSMGNWGNREIHLRTLLNRFPQSSYYSQALEILSNSHDNIPVESRSIGVLLPMKGKFAKFGSKSLQGIQLAFGIFNSEDSDSQINLIVEDSGDETEQTIKALNRLVLKHHVIAVIGPMLTKGTDQIAQRAQELGVPLISLARRAGPYQDYVFQAGLTQQIQTHEIARYAIKHLGLKRFAILYPKEKLGLEASQSFWDAVESMGGKIVGIEGYNPEETDFRQAVDKLSGLAYTEARQREIDLLAQEREANNIKKRTRKTEQFFRLKPIVDFDAVFIPDDPKVTGQILPTFAYRDIEHVKFLGTSAWNSPDFLSRAQTYAEHATFVDGYFAESNSSLVKKFTEKYKATYDQNPTSLEALAYDAGLILKNIFNSSTRNLSRADVRDRLKAIHEFQGITGKISYKEGQFYRNLTVVKVKGGHFVQAKQDPEI